MAKKPARCRNTEKTSKVINAMLDLSQWEKWAERPSTVQRDDIIARQTWADGKTPFLSIPKGNNVEYWMPIKEKHFFYTNITNSLLKTTAEKHLKKYNALAEQIIKSSEINPTLPNNELAERYLKFCKINDEFAFFYHSPWAVEKYLDAILKEKLQHELGEEKGNTAYYAITLPTELITFQKMQIELRKMKNPTKEELKQVVKKYAWMAEYSLKEELYNEDYFGKQIKLIAQNEEDLIARIEKNKKEFEKTINELTAETKKLAKMINLYITLRTHRIDALKKAMTNLRPFLKHLSKLMNLQYLEVVTLTREEVVNFLEKGETPDLKEVKKRAEGKLAYLYNGKVHFIPVNAIVKKEQTTNENKTTGKIANRGVATGPAIIIKTKSDLLKVRTGCVLVSCTTYPEYTPFMKKAVAIVTDEGGITSHAAIVSRELQIPCIVGTKNSTKIFKDNELIIVNANEGTATKLD